MHELFLTAVVSAADFERATAILQGLCAMSAFQSVHHVIYLAGPTPPAPRGLPNTRLIQPSPFSKLWAELGQQLARQSFILQARYEVFKDRSFGAGQADAAAANGPANGGGGGGTGVVISGNDWNTTPGTLRWSDIPDPPGNRPVVQRKSIQIPEQRFLVSILLDNSHRFKSDAIEESYTYFRDGIEFSLVRYYELPKAYTNDGKPQPRLTFPAWGDLDPVDPARKWVLFVKSHVLEDNSPDKMQKAHDELMDIREELMGVFDFKVFDRRSHDTRLTQQFSNTPIPLPQTVRA